MKTMIFVSIALLMPFLPIQAKSSVNTFASVEKITPGRTYAYFPDLKEYVKTNLKYPISARENYVQGKVEATFLVEADGSVSDVQIVGKLSASCDRAVIQLLKNMPAWTPATKNGRPIAQKMDITVRFELEP